MSIWITTEDWAKSHLPSTTLSRATLSRYARSGQFNPPARKIGRAWHVHDDAQLINPVPVLPNPAITDPRVAAIYTSING